MTPKRIVLHCTDTPNGKSVALETLVKDHVAKGWKTIGYHLVINVDGEVYRGRGLNEEGAHCIGANSDSIGICLVGRDKYTHKQWNALRYQLDSLCMLYRIDAHEIYGHYEFSSAQLKKKTCPGVRAANVVAWFIGDDIRAISKNLLKGNA